MEKDITFSLILNARHERYLNAKRAGRDRNGWLFGIIETVIEKIEAATTIDANASWLWQVDISEVTLSKLWGCDRKTVSKTLDEMNALHILSSTQTRRGSTHTLLVVSGWIVDGMRYVNPHYISVLKRGKAATENPQPQTCQPGVAAPSFANDISGNDKHGS